MSFPASGSAVLTGVILALVDVGGSLHAVVAQYLEQLVPEGADVLLDLIEVILRHALCLRSTLSLHDVPLYQVTHDLLQESMKHGFR